MAGQRPTAREQREQTNHDVFFPFSKAALTSVQYMPLFTAEIDTVVEYASIRFGVGGGGARTVKLAYAASGTAPSAAQAITTTLSVNAPTVDVNYPTEPDRVATAAQASARNWAFLDSAGNAIVYGASSLPGFNVVPAGATVYMVFSDATVGNLDGVALTMRTTQKIK